MSSQAVFWDRDKTLIADPGYINNPDQVELLPGATDAIRMVAQAGFQNILVTNQSGIARGYLTEEQLAEIHDWLVQLLAEEGASLDAIYYCPYLDSDKAVVPQYRRDSDLRKPKPGMLVKASLERKIDLVASWCVGNNLSDVQAGRAAGCRTILITPDPSVAAQMKKQSNVDFVVASVREAADTVLKYTRIAGEKSTAEPEKVAARTATEGNVAGILQEILTFLRMVDKRSQVEDFSLARLAGTVTQILALGALLWGIFAIIRGQEYGAQIVPLLVGLLLQLIALTFFVLSSKK